MWGTQLGATWLKVGRDFLNLNLILAVRVARDDTGTWSATVETAQGHVKHYTGPEAAALKRHLDDQTADPVSNE